MVYSDTVCSWCCRCVAGVESKMSHFLDDVHIVEALNEPVDDSSSEGDVLETEYSLSESDSDSCTVRPGMKIRNKIVI